MYLIPQIDIFLTSVWIVCQKEKHQKGESMKRLFIFPFLILFLSQGCVRFGNNGEGTPPEFEYLIQELNVYLDFDQEQRTSARASLERGKDFHPDPAALWKLAAYLHKNLTLEQKQKLLAPPGDIDPTILSEENDYHFKRIERFQRMDTYMRSILNADQLEAYDTLIEYKRINIELLIDLINDGDIEHKTFRFELMGIMEWFRAEMGILLTDEQKSLLLDTRDREDRRWRSGRRGWGRFSNDPEEIKMAMYNALDMTHNQITTLENIHEDFRKDLGTLRDEFIDGTNNHTAGEYRSAVVSIISGNHNRRESVFTQGQKEIIEIHRALTRHYMKHTQWGKRS